MIPRPPEAPEAPKDEMVPASQYEPELITAHARFVAELAAQTPQSADDKERHVMSSAEGNMRRAPTETTQSVTALDRNPEPVTDAPPPLETPHDEPSPLPTPFPDQEQPETIPINPGPALDPQTPTIPAPQEAHASVYQSSTNHLRTSPELAIQRVIVRVPVGRMPSFLVARSQVHAPPVQLLTAIVAFRVLVALRGIG